MYRLPPRRPKDEPLGVFGWLVLGTLIFEWVFILYWAGAFRPLP